MKINFKNPKSGKPSTVIVADHLVELLDLSLAIDPCVHTQDIHELVRGAAMHYYVYGYPEIGFPRFTTFTQAVEYSITLRVKVLLNRLAEKAGVSYEYPGTASLVPKPSDDNLPLPLD